MILVRPEAREALLALPKPTRRQLQQAIDALSTQPNPPEAVAVADHPNTHRLPVANHQLIYAIHEGEVLILLIAPNQAPTTG